MAFNNYGMRSNHVEEMFRAAGVDVFRRPESLDVELVFKDIHRRVDGMHFEEICRDERAAQHAIRGLREEYEHNRNMKRMAMMPPLMHDGPLDEQPLFPWQVHKQTAPKKTAEKDPIRYPELITKVAPTTVNPLILLLEDLP